jgi:NADH-quinone oxidoreductase subunit M
MALSVLLILLPLVGALVAFAMRGVAVRSVALGFTLLNLLVTALIWSGFNPAETGYAHEVAMSWIPSAGISFAIGIDGISLVLLLLTNLVAPLIVLSSYARSFDSEGRYYGLVLLMLSALNGVFMARDGMLFYMRWR